MVNCKARADLDLGSGKLNLPPEDCGAMVFGEYTLTQTNPNKTVTDFSLVHLVLINPTTIYCCVIFQ